jgi:TonB family protein
MNQRRAAFLLTGLLLAGCGGWDRGADSDEGYPVFPNTPPKVRPKPQAFSPGDLRYDHPVYRYPPPSDPNAPMRNPEEAAKVLQEVPPEYTAIAQRAGIAGIVLLEVVVDANGDMSTVRVLKPLPFGLDQKAIEAVRKWRFAPARHRGKPVPSYRNVTVRFTPPRATQ